MPDRSLRAFANRLRGIASRTPAAARADAELLARFARERDESAFAELVGRYGRLVQGVCRGVLGDEQDAEEATQATFLLLARRATSLRQPKALAGWLYGVAYRTALRARRAATRRRLHEARIRPVPAATTGPVAEASLREFQAILGEELERLPERLRAPFTLCCLEGYGQEEAAQMLGCKAGTVGSRLDAARKLLRTRLARRGVSLSAVLCALTAAGGRARAGLTAALASRIVASTRRHESGGAPAGRLAGDVLRETVWARVKAAAVAAVVLGALAAGVALSLRDAGANPAEAAGTAAARPAPPAAGGNLPGPRLDRSGDELPDAALVRMGSKRFVHGWYTESTVWSPDGKVIASLGGDQSDRGICLWDPATGRELRRLDTAYVAHAAAFSPDGKTLVVAEGRGVVLWDLATGKVAARLIDWPDGRGQGSGVAAAFAPDGRTVAGATYKDAFQVREVATGRLVVELKAGNLTRATAAYAPDGKSLACADFEGAVVLWDVATWKEKWRGKARGDAAWCLAFSPDGKTLASAGADGVVHVCETTSGKELLALGEPIHDWLRLYSHYAPAVAYSPDGRTLAAPGQGGLVRLWDLATGKELRNWQTGDLWVISLSFSPDGRKLATTSYPSFNRVRFWDPVTGKELHPAAGHNGTVRVLCYSPDGKTVWSAAQDRSVWRWDTSSGEGKRLTGVSTGPFLAESINTPTAFAPDGRTFAVGTDDGRIRLWDGDGRPLGMLEGNDHAAVQGLAFSPDGKVVVSSSYDHVLRFWDLSTRRQLPRPEAPRGGWPRMAFSPDGRKLALAPARGGAADGFAAVVDTLTGKELYRLETTPPPVYAVFSPDGRIVATSGHYPDRFLRFWDAATGAPISQLDSEPDHMGWGCLAFSPDGRLLATRSFNRLDTIVLLDTATLEEVATLQGHHSGISALAFSADGRSLASAAHDATMMIWDLTGRAATGGRGRELLSPLQLEGCWKDLGGTDARAAYQAVRALAADPVRAVPFLGRHLGRSGVTDPAGLNQSLADPGAAAPEWPRQRRAVSALEYAATPEARQLLEALAEAKDEPRLSQEARESLARLNGSTSRPRQATRSPLPARPVD